MSTKLNSTAVPIAALVTLCAMAPLFVLSVVADTRKASVVQYARQLAQAGQTEQAVRVLCNALAAHPADLDARLVLAGIYANNSEDDKAENELHEALHLYPDSSAAAMALGTLYIRHALFPAAEQVLADDVRRHPKLAGPRAELAMVLAGEHKYEEAAANIRMVPPPVEATERVRYFRLTASIQSGLGNRHGAARAMEAALQVKPDDPELQVLAGLAEADAEEWRTCIRNVAPLFARNPTPSSGLLLLKAQLARRLDVASTLQGLRMLDLPKDKRLDLNIRTAELLASAEKHEEAAKEFQEALRIAGSRDQNLLYNLAVEQDASGQYEQALATLEPLRAGQDSAEVEDLVGDVEEGRGNSSASIRSHQSAVALAPNEERYRLSLGAALLQYHAYKPASEVFEEAASLFPGSARSYVGLGIAYYFMERYSESASAFLHADQLDGGSGRALGYLGATQVESVAGPSPTAVEAICGRADSHHDDSIAFTWCGALLFRKAYLAGDPLAAQPAIQRLLLATMLAPRDAIAACSLGRALAWTERMPEARHWLEICVRLRPDSAEDHYRLSLVYQRLGLKQAAAEQADLTTNLSAQQDQREDIAQKFAQQVLAVSKSPTK